MTKVQRIKKILTALLMLLCCYVVVKDTELGIMIAALIVAVSMLVYALRCLIFYFTMARHMVGGLSTLFRGIIVFDLSVFTVSMVDDTRLYIVLYLLGFHAFAGLMDILRALEAKRYQDPAWRWSLLYGIANLSVAVMAVVVGIFLDSTRDLAYLYAACLFCTAVAQLVSAFRRTAIVYIQ